MKYIAVFLCCALSGAAFAAQAASKTYPQGADTYPTYPQGVETYPTYPQDTYPTYPQATYPQEGDTYPQQTYPETSKTYPQTDKAWPQTDEAWPAGSDAGDKIGQAVRQGSKEMRPAEVVRLHPRKGNAHFILHFDSPYYTLALLQRELQIDGYKLKLELYKGKGEVLLSAWPQPQAKPLALAFYTYPKDGACHARLSGAELENAPCRSIVVKTRDGKKYEVADLK